MKNQERKTISDFPSNQESLEKARVYLDLCQKTDQIIQQAYTKLTDKIKSIFTLASALIPVVAALGYFIAKETSAYWILFPTFFSISALVSAICLGISFFRPKNFKYVDPKTVIDDYKGKGKPLRYFLNKWASTYCDIANKNAQEVNSGEKRLNYMYSCIVIGLAILAVSFLLLGISYANPEQLFEQILSTFGYN